MINNKKLLQIEPVTHDAIREHANFSMGISSPGDRTRAIVKVQDGCSAFCTYCIIPFVRGRMTSRPLEDIMKEYIKSALAQTQGNQTKAAKLLGMSRRKLQNRMKNYNLDSRDFKEEQAKNLVNTG